MSMSALKTSVTDQDDQQSSRRVLVVDDMADLANLLRQMIKLLGYDCVAVSTVKEALSAFNAAISNSKPFDMVITDLVMPGEDSGTQLMQKLRGIDPLVKVIASSGYRASTSDTTDPENGFCGRLNKPFTIGELQAELHRHLTV